MKIYRKLRPEFMKQAGELLAEAFEDKFRYFLGTKAVIQKVIPHLINKEQVLSIVSDTNELIGIAGFSYEQKSMFSMNMKAMVRQYGLIKGVYKMFQMGVYFPNSFPVTHLYIDAITIKADYRGKGYIRLLFQELEKIAFEKGTTNLQLEVSCDNAAAIRAYRKMGFYELKSETLNSSVACRVGISRLNRMIKILDQYLANKRI